MRSERRRQITSEAEDLLLSYNVVAPPVPVEQIADKLKIIVEYKNLDDELSGFIFEDNGRAIVVINRAHHLNRKRFTLAHEIGHFILHMDELAGKVHVEKGYRMLPRNRVSSSGYDRREIEANLFAASLLVPEKFLRHAIKKAQGNLDDEVLVTDLAKMFSVSEAAMSVRIGSVLQ